MTDLICNECGYHYEGKHKCKRGVNNISEYCDVEAIVDIVKNAQLKEYPFEPYKRIRDRALLALLASTGLRVMEALSIEKEQIDNQNDVVVIKTVKILKRRKQPIKKDFPLFKSGIYSELTLMFLAWSERVKKGKLFNISRFMAYRIVNDSTGKWCHFFRSQRLSYLVNKIRSAAAVANIQGIAKSSTIDHYLKTDWKQFEEEMRG